MKQLYPAYYREFRCIAARCPDSCCQGWDVVIDSDTEAVYNTVEGAFGDRLRTAIITDEDGDRIFRLADNKKCPFWSDDRLCDIYKTLGEATLCATCARFPRLTMDYTVFREYSLALACPEAARLILTTDDAYAAFAAVTVEDCADYDPALMRFLLKARQEAAQLLTAGKPLLQRLDDLFAHTIEVQNTLTGDAEDAAWRLPAERFTQLEYIDNGNRERITRAAAAAADLSQHEQALTNLALYWLYRYYLGAIDSLDVLSPVRFLVASLHIVANLAKAEGELITAAQTYSKEIEQSYENMEALWDVL